MYTLAFIEINNWHSIIVVYETYEIVEIEKHLISRVKNYLDLGCQQFYKIFKVL